MGITPPLSQDQREQNAARIVKVRFTEAERAALLRAAFLLRKEGNGQYDREQAAIIEAMLNGHL